MSSKKKDPIYQEVRKNREKLSLEYTQDRKTFLAEGELLRKKLNLKISVLKPMKLNLTKKYPKKVA